MLKNNNASWIEGGAAWIGAAGEEKSVNLYRRFLRSFNLNNPEDIKVNITAVSAYQFFVNGEMIQRGPAMSYQSLYYYDEIIIPAHMLSKGENRFAVLMFHDGDPTETIQGFQYGKPGMLFQAFLPDEIIVSDANWKTSLSPLYSGQSMVSKWGFYKEFYHEEKEDGWLDPLFDFGSWPDSEIVAPLLDDNFVTNLKRNDLPPLEERMLKPSELVDVHRNGGSVSISADSCPMKWDGRAIRFDSEKYGAIPSVTFDYGTIVVGYPEIHIEGDLAIYEVWYGETLDLYRLDCIRTGSTGIWKSFQRRAYRYIQIRIIAQEGPVSLEHIGHLNSWYGYDKRAVLQGSDEQMNKVLDVSKQTLKANTSYHYEDCPWREQALWVFDLRVMARINYYNYGNSDIVEKNLRQMFALQRPDGSIPATGPKENNCNTIDFCYHLVGTLREYYEYTGNLEFLKETLDSLNKLHVFLENFRSESGLMHNHGVAGWGPFLDWSSDIDKCGESVILNSLYIRYLEDRAFILGELGEEKRSLLEEAEKMKTLADKLLFSDKEGLYRDTVQGCFDRENYSIQGNLAALYGGVAKEDRKNTILAMLDQPDKYALPYGPSFYQIVFDAMASEGRFEEIVKQIRRYWGGMLDRDVPTWWEVFNPDSPRWEYPHPFLGNTPTYEMDWIPVSTCHGWSGAPAYAIPRYLLGVELNELYRNKITINPNLPGYFEDFTYELPVHGEMLKLRFTGEKDKYSIDVLEKPESIELEILEK